MNLGFYLDRVYERRLSCGASGSEWTTLELETEGVSVEYEISFEPTFLIIQRRPRSM